MDQLTINSDFLPKVIKRYTNRKLYDTEASCYVTLDDVTKMVQAGANVRIIDHQSHEDLTRVVLMQIILEAERRQNHMPVAFLFEIIRHFGQSLPSPDSAPQDESSSMFQRLLALERKLHQLESGQALSGMPRPSSA